MPTLSTRKVWYAILCLLVLVYLLLSCVAFANALPAIRIISATNRHCRFVYSRLYPTCHTVHGLCLVFLCPTCRARLAHLHTREADLGAGTKSPAPWRSSPTPGNDDDAADQARRRSTLGGETDSEVCMLCYSTASSSTLRPCVGVLDMCRPYL